MAVFSRISTVRVTTVAGAYREWIATAPVQDFAEGTSQVITVTQTVSGAVPPTVPDTLTVVVYADNGQTVIGTFSLTASSASQTFTLFMKDNGASGGTNIADTLRMRIRAVNTSGGVGNTYDVNSDNGQSGSPASTPMTSGTVSAQSAGWVRGSTTAVSTLSNVSYGGAKPNPFSYLNAVYLSYVMGSKSAISRTNTITFGVLSASIASATVNFQNTFAVGSIANNWAIALTTGQATAITISNASLTALPYASLPITVTTPDTSGNARTGTLVGSVLPTVVTTPLAGMQFEGVDRDDLSSGVNCGTAGFGVSTADGSMQIKATIRRTRSGFTEAFAGKWGGIATGNYLFYTETDGSLRLIVMDSTGTVVQAISTTLLGLNVDYPVEVNWTGTALNVKINGVQNGSTPAITTLRAPDATTPFTIGRVTFEAATSVSPFPFQGIIKDVEMRRGGVLQGQYALTSTTSTGAITNDTANVDPRITFSQLLQVNDNVFGTPPSIKDNGGSRLTSDLGFMAARAVDSNGGGINSIVWTAKLWDNGNLVGSEASPVKSRVSTSQTQGGQAGWSDAFLVWDNGLPGGLWTHKQIISTTNAVGLELSNSRTSTLLSKNPNYVIEADGGLNSTTSFTHFVVGKPLIIGASLIDSTTRKYLMPDTSPAPTAVLGQFDLSTGVGKYLRSSDFTFVPLGTGVADFHTLTASAGDPFVFVKTLTGAQTSAWASYGIQAMVLFYVNGTPYTQGFTITSVGSANGHDGYKLDAVQLALSGVIGTH